MTRIKNFVAIFQDVMFLKHFHGWATIFWLLLSLPAMLFWAESITFLVFVSVYAIVVSHWSNWQGARAEAKADPEVDI